MKDFIKFLGFGTLTIGAISTLFIVALVFSLVFSLLSGTVFFFLWNWLAPLVWAAAPVLSWFEAVGIWFLVGMVSRMCFKRSSK